MTLHVQYSHQCPRCGAFYIPYDRDVTCPRCGLLENERFDYISAAVASLRFNKMDHGHYTPSAWWVGSLGDHVLNILFGLFDSYDESLPGGFDQFARQYLERMRWGEQAYLFDHIKGIALRLHAELAELEVRV